MAVRNASVARGYISTSNYTSVYTVPTGFVLLLKNVIVTQTGGQATNYVLNLVDSTGATTMAFAAGASATDGIIYWSGWTVLNAGDQLRIQASNPTVGYWVSGAVLPYFPGL